MSPKKILIINKFCPFHPLTGGAEKFLFEILKRLNNHQIYYLCVRFPGSLKEERKENITFIRVGLPFFFNVLTANILLPLVFRKYLKKINPDLVIENIGTIPFFTPLLDFAQKYNKVIILHQFNRHFFLKNKRYFFGLISYLLEKLFLIFYRQEVVFFVSQWLKKELILHNFTKIYHLNCGVEEKYFAINKKYSRLPTILYLNRIEYRKGLDLLLKVYPLIKAKIPNIKLQIAGNFFYFGNKKFIKKIKKYQQEFPEIEFLGYVDENTKMRLFSSCWLFVNPSRLEGYGISNLEANATGTFVIANDVLGLQESVNGGGILIDFSNPEKTASTIIEWLNIEKLKRKENICRAWAKKHNWDKTFKKFVKVIKNEFNLDI